MARRSSYINKDIYSSRDACEIDTVHSRRSHTRSDYARITVLRNRHDTRHKEENKFNGRVTRAMRFVFRSSQLSACEPILEESSVKKILGCAYNTRMCPQETSSASSHIDGNRYASNECDSFRSTTSRMCRFAIPST